MAATSSNNTQTILKGVEDLITRFKSFISAETDGIKIKDMNKYINFINNIINNKIKTAVINFGFSYDKRIRTSGFIIFCFALFINTSIEEIDIDIPWNIDMDDVIKFLQPALIRKQNIIDLILHSSNRENFSTFLASVIEESRALRKLYLEHASIIKEDDITTILKALSMNNTLEYINISKMKIKNSQSKYLKKLLKNNKRLLNLNISFTDLESDGMIYIAEGLKTNHSLEELNISYCRIESKGAAYISDAIKINNTLKILKMEACDIGNEGAIYISEALKINNSLRLLNIGKCNIGDAGVEALSSALLINNTLYDLFLSHNYDITNKGINALANALKYNSNLGVLQLNGLSGKLKIKPLFESLLNNDSLHTLNVTGLYISPKTAKYIEYLLNVNSSLINLYIGWRSDDNSSEFVAYSRLIDLFEIRRDNNEQLSKSLTLMALNEIYDNVD